MNLKAIKGFNYLRYINKICELYEEYSKIYPQILNKKLEVINIPDGDDDNYPCFNWAGISDNSDNETDIIYLSIYENDTSYEQITYQFIHELTHLREYSKTTRYTVSDEEEAKCYDESIIWLLIYGDAGKQYILNAIKEVNDSPINKEKFKLSYFIQQYPKNKQELENVLEKYKNTHYSFLKM